MYVRDPYGIILWQFGLTKKDYHDKTILDIGCGPRGSLEWLEDASLRCGLDPLAHNYCKLGVLNHSMIYINSIAEKIIYAFFKCNIIQLTANFFL